MSHLTRRAFLTRLQTGFQPRAAELQRPATSDPGVQIPTGTLSPWVPTLENPWGANAVLHFYQRLGFGVSKSRTDLALVTTPAALLDLALDDRWLTDAGLPPYPSDWDFWMHTPPYSGTDHAGYQEQERVYQGGKEDIRLWWTTLMMDPNTYLREKLVYIWANHFVVELQKNYYPKHVYNYWDCLRRFAWGNLKEMIKQITIQPAMLLYLNGEDSFKDGLSENYARESMELFLMGRVDRYGNPNYTQDDVRAVASAVCGWRFWIDAPAPDTIHSYFAEYYFDFTKKTTPFGAPGKVYGMMAAKEKGLFPYLDVGIEADIFDVMFEFRGEQISWHIAETIYHAFVSPDSSAASSQQVIEEMAQVLRNSNWELKPMLRALFTSEHFFDLTFRGGVIKSPYEYMLSMCQSLDIPFARDQAGTADYQAKQLYISLMNPPNVKGWPGDHEWLNSSTLPKRNRNIANPLTLDGDLPSPLVDWHTGFSFGSWRWNDDQLRTWAAQFAGYTHDIALFVSNISDLMLAIPIGAVDIPVLLRSVGLYHTTDWPTLDQASRLALTRRIVNAILLLPQYQLQ